MTHTPGPWTIGLYDATGDFRAIKTHVAVCKPDGALLATCGPVDKESRADARLIAAAPELLEAVKMIPPLLRLAAYPSEQDSPLIERLVALIAKAEGKS